VREEIRNIKHVAESEEAFAYSSEALKAEKLLRENWKPASLSSIRSDPI
jgi:hypothetical protein